MARIKCFNEKGNEVEIEAVDARECVEHLGWSLTKPEPGSEPEPESKENCSTSKIKNK